MNNWLLQADSKGEIYYTNKETKEVTEQEVTVDKDECNRPSTTLENLAALNPINGPDKFITAGNASQLSDGASSCVLMDLKEAEKRNIEINSILTKHIRRYNKLHH